MGLTAAETRGMKFCKSGTNVWTSVNNAYTITCIVGTETLPVTRTVPSYILKDGHGGFLGRFTSKAAAVRGAREDLIVKH
jgi:hypothetical protein